MEKKKFIFAEADEGYLYSIVGKFVQQQKDAVEIECITSEEYLERISGEPIKCDVLIMAEEWYVKYFQKQNITEVFLLTEQMDAGADNEQSAENSSKIRRVYKYSSVQEIYIKIMSRLPAIEASPQKVKATKVVAVHSSVGGSGKTNLTIGLCAALKKFGNRVLYINLENIQNFNYLLEDREYLGAGQWNQGLTGGLESLVRNKEFDYIPPLRQSSVACGVSYQQVLAALESLCNKYLYDYILVELPLDLDNERLQVLSTAYKVVFVTKQDALSVWKMERFLENIDYSDRNKFILVCNFFQETRENFTMKSRKMSVSENIPWMEDATELQSVQSLMYSNTFEKLAYLLM